MYYVDEIEITLARISYSIAASSTESLGTMT
jgi:hypothetical protein